MRIRTTLARQGRAARLRTMAILAVLLTLVVVGGVASPAAADSGWRCASITNGSICLRTYTYDPKHLSRVDVMYTKYSGSCISVQFGHRITSYKWTEIDRWYSPAGISICQGQSKSYTWTHAGTGAYVPNAGFVEAIMVVVGQGTFYGPSIEHPNL